MTNIDRPWDLVEAYAVDSKDVFVAAALYQAGDFGPVTGPSKPGR